MDSLSTIFWPATAKSQVLFYKSGSMKHEFKPPHPKFFFAVNFEVFFHWKLRRTEKIACLLQKNYEWQHSSSKYPFTVKQSLQSDWRSCEHGTLDISDSKNVTQLQVWRRGIGYRQGKVVVPLLVVASSWVYALIHQSTKLLIEVMITQTASQLRNFHIAKKIKKFSHNINKRRSKKIYYSFKFAHNYCSSWVMTKLKTMKKKDHQLIIEKRVEDIQCGRNIKCTASALPSSDVGFQSKIHIWWCRWVPW